MNRLKQLITEIHRRSLWQVLLIYCGAALVAYQAVQARMTSSAAAKTPLPGVRGLVFLGFPLHSPATPGDQRAEHLYGLQLPMLFLQGTRDEFARLDLRLG